MSALTILFLVAFVAMMAMHLRGHGGHGHGGHGGGHGHDSHRREPDVPFAAQDDASGSGSTPVAGEHRHTHA